MLVKFLKVVSRCSKYTDCKETNMYEIEPCYINTDKLIEIRNSPEMEKNYKSGRILNLDLNDDFKFLRLTLEVGSSKEYIDVIGKLDDVYSGFIKPTRSLLKD